MTSALEHIRPLLIGQDATRIEFIWQDIFRGTFWRGGPVLQSALAGIDIALWDLAGKALGAPTYRLLGGAARDKVLAYRHVYAPTPEELGEKAQADAGRGLARAAHLAHRQDGQGIRSRAGRADRRRAISPHCARPSATRWR